jgi:hypothetical protein
MEGWKIGRMGAQSSILPSFHFSYPPKCQLFSETCHPTYQVLSDLSDKDSKIATLEARIKALENQLQPEKPQSEKVIQFPKFAKRKKSS